jgi:flagellar motor switch protein FliG
VASDESKNIYINGKQQVIELIQHMDQKDKMTLLKNLRHRNPALAKELSETAFTYESIWYLSDDILKKILITTKPIVLGLALHLESGKNQKRALSLLAREQAISVYEVMIKDLSQNRRECVKAQGKILENALDLGRRKVIILF